MRPGWLWEMCSHRGQRNLAFRTGADRVTHVLGLVPDNVDDAAVCDAGNSFRRLASPSTACGVRVIVASTDGCSLYCSGIRSLQAASRVIPAAAPIEAKMRPARPARWPTPAGWSYFVTARLTHQLGDVLLAEICKSAYNDLPRHPDDLTDLPAGQCYLDEKDKVIDRCRSAQFSSHCIFRACQHVCPLRLLATRNRRCSQPKS